ncbi:hypothetical protein DUNSADRAFT_1523 [Dunaliella salina]|uniref:Imidazole glycerol phosphate synthase hisHF n=1 Tax=Dunaliella salina TaxID=3046 RepID=A0ABQ7GWZ4_DUNSA|nr:hypothetical protein DUNSADRAFT_1523 [Dunaliella salina]|eukprot:KAF5839125.1 hypothetical protein DUNSADRAFT_1523 [Dunaliella salina]
MQVGTSVSVGSRQQLVGDSCLRRRIPPRYAALRAVAAAAGKEVTLLDYGAGNVRSVRNAIMKLGYSIKDVEKPSDISSAAKLIFPGVGSFGQAMRILKQKELVDPLKEYIDSGKPFLGVCLGLQLLFEGSEESGGCEGLGMIPGQVCEFDKATLGLPVPHIGWNDMSQKGPSPLLSGVGDKRVYFVHSYRAVPEPRNADWVLATTDYGDPFVAAVGKGNIYATQFHPEKSGATGLQILNNFLEPSTPASPPASPAASSLPKTHGLARRVIACLDVRANDRGDLVVTKGDQYDVREKEGERDVRNLGKPVELAARYFDDGADEVSFLNITGFRDCPLNDLPMIKVLKEASRRVFVPLTVGGGIRGFKDVNGTSYSALDVASSYFRSGADKVSIGSDAVDVAEEYIRSGVRTGQTSIEQISEVYGRQAVVVSIDPKRVYVADPSQVKHKCTKTSKPGPNGEQWCWWQCTVKGGREGRDLGAVELAQAVEALGTGEILLNCIDCDGAKQGFDHELVGAVSDAVSIPVIASSGAGVPEHFTQVFKATRCSAALAAGIFHRQEVNIADVKQHMAENLLPTRL